MVIQNIMLRFDKTFYSLLLRSVTLIYILATNYEYDANISLFFRSCFNDCVQADADFSWRPDAGALEAGRRQSRHKTRASWRPEQTQDTGRADSRHRHRGSQTQLDALEAGCRQSGRKTQG